MFLAREKNAGVCARAELGWSRLCQNKRATSEYAQVFDIRACASQQRIGAAVYIRVPDAVSDKHNVAYRERPETYGNICVDKDGFDELRVSCARVCRKTVPRRKRKEIESTSCYHYCPLQFISPVTRFEPAYRATSVI